MYLKALHVCNRRLFASVEHQVGPRRRESTARTRTPSSSPSASTRTACRRGAIFRQQIIAHQSEWRAIGGPARAKISVIFRYRVVRFSGAMRCHGVLRHRQRTASRLVNTSCAVARRLLRLPRLRKLDRCKPSSKSTGGHAINITYTFPS